MGILGGGELLTRRLGPSLAGLAEEEASQDGPNGWELLDLRAPPEPLPGYQLRGPGQEALLAVAPVQLDGAGGSAMPEAEEL